MSDYDYFGGYQEDTATEETSTEEQKTEGSLLGVERSDEDDPFDDRRITYPGYYENSFQSPPPEGQEKKKVGYYFRRTIAERLDELTMYLDRHTDIGSTKSNVVESAVELMLRDWELNGDRSAFLNWIQQRHEQ